MRRGDFVGWVEQKEARLKRASFCEAHQHLSRGSMMGFAITREGRVIALPILQCLAPAIGIGGHMQMRRLVTIALAALAATIAPGVGVTSSSAQIAPPRYEID